MKPGNPVRTHRLLIALVLLAVLAVTGPAAATDAGSAFTRRERFGVAFARVVQQGSQSVPQALDTYELAALQLGWYSDWSYNAKPLQPRDVTPETQLEYVQLITVRDGQWPPNWSAVQAAATANPGALWIIGNEPECPNQGNLTPAQYAQRYHQTLLKIRGWDSSAKFAIGGVVEPTPLRLRWLDRTLTSYQTQFGHPMTDDIDVWTVHMQILTEGAPGDNSAGAGIPVGISFTSGEGMEYSLADCANIELFKSLIRDFRTWLAGKNEREKPLIISEMGVLQPSYYLTNQGTEAERKEAGDRLIEQFMGHAFDWLLEATSPTIGCTTDGNHLVQRWLWFSLNDSFYDEDTNPKGFNGSLFDYKTRQLTRFGRRFIAARTQVYEVNVPIVRRK